MAMAARPAQNRNSKRCGHQREPETTNLERERDCPDADLADLISNTVWLIPIRKVIAADLPEGIYTVK